MSFKNAISWFEIPATDLDRAAKFYEAIFNITLIPMELPDFKMRMFPLEDMMGVGGALVSIANEVNTDNFYQPSSTHGVLIYLNANPDVQQILDRVEATGGKIVVPKTEISPEHGFMGIFLDTEGNRIGLHSIPQS